MRQFRLENHSWERVSQMTDATFSYTNDSGRGEKRFNTIHYDNLDLFDYWRPPRPDSIGQFDEDVEVADPVISLRHVLQVNGLSL